MKHFTKILTALLCATVLCGIVVVSACANNNMQARVTELEQKITQLKTQNQNLQTAVSEKEAQITELEEENADLKEDSVDLEQLSNSLAQLQQQLNELNFEYNEYKNKNDQVVEDLEVYIQELESQLADEKQEPEVEVTVTEISQPLTLEKVYEDGLITKEDLLNIAYYYNDGEGNADYQASPLNPESLNAVIEKAIKQEFAKWYNEYCAEQHGVTTSYTEEGIAVWEYLGTYNNYVAVKIEAIDAMKPGWFSWKDIGGVSFKHCAGYEDLYLFMVEVH